MMSTTTTTATPRTLTKTKTTAGRQTSTSPPRESRAAGPASTRKAGQAAGGNATAVARPGRATSYADDYSGPEYGSGPGYGADEFATGAYDLPDGADEDRSDRTRRRRRDREDRGERTGILRLRRDRGEDIWPDDGISDEDYWASVAADRPLNGTDSPLDNLPATGGSPRPGGDARPRTDARPGMGGGADSRFGDQRGGERGVTGRLGPPPGIAGDYKPGAARTSGPMGAGQPGGSGRNGSGRNGSGPMPARPGTGPQPARPGTGPTPTVGVTASRPPAGQNGMRPGPAQPGPAQNGYAQPAARPSFQPNGYQAGGRPQDRRRRLGRPDRADRTRQRLRLPRSPAKRPWPGLWRHRGLRATRPRQRVHARARPHTQLQRGARARPGRQRPPGQRPCGQRASRQRRMAGARAPGTRPS